MEVTELEVATVTYAVLTGVTYYLWWKKPLDVRCSIPVFLLRDDEKDADLQGTSLVSPVANPDAVTVSPLMSCDLNSNQSLPISEEIQIPQKTLIIMSDRAQAPRKSEPSHDDVTASPKPQLTGMQQFSAFIQRQIQKRTVLGLAYAFLFCPPFSFFRGLSRMFVSVTLHDSMSLRVPTFYSPQFTDHDLFNSSFVIATCVAAIFGASMIHCAAWTLHFPSVQERLAWKISAAYITGLPILFNLLPSWWGTNAIFDVVIYGFPVLYVFARIVLLVLPCIVLRALPPTALVEIQWAAFSPHIG